MICRYCGYELATFAQQLKTENGTTCKGNPNGIHVGVTDGKSCVFCGQPVRTYCGKLRAANGDTCPHSPTKMHCLQ